MIQGFERVGPQIPFGESRVGVDEVEPIRDFLALDLQVMAGKIWHGAAEGQYGVTSYAMYFKPFDEFEAEAVDRFVTVRLVDMPSLEAWRLMVGIRSFQTAGRYSNKLIRYCFETQMGELAMAKKEVYLIMGRLMMEPASEGIDQKFVEQRKMYERPLDEEDCEEVMGIVRSTYNRRLVTRRRRGVA